MTATLTRRVPSSAGNPVDVHAVVAAILAATDGTTVDRTGRPYGGDGIIVARPEHGYIVPVGHLGMTSERLARGVARWVTRVAPEVSATASPRRYFGAWVSGDSLYLDVVDAYSSADRDLAIAAGRARNQIAVWDAGRGVEISTGGTGALQVTA